MKVNEMLVVLKEMREPTGIKLGTVIQVGEHDAIAAHLLEGLYEFLDDTATQADVDGIIDSMKWWSTFFHTMVPTDKAKLEDEA